MIDITDYRVSKNAINVGQTYHSRTSKKVIIYFDSNNSIERYFIDGILKR